MFNKLRYFLIELLSGDMPVVINMNITRPKNFKGNLAYFPINKPVLFTKNILWNEPKKSILTPKRDVDLETTDL